MLRISVASLLISLPLMTALSAPTVSVNLPFQISAEERKTLGVEAMQSLPAEKVEREALASGNADKIYLAAKVYEMSPIEDPDSSKSRALFQKAAELGNEDAKVRLIWYKIQETNFQCPMDGILKEVDELRKSGSEMAELTHIQLLVMGFRGEQRISEGMERLSKLAAEGNPNALYLLGCYYLEGVGGPKNPDKAFEFLSQAAEKNHGLANLNLGICYGHGIGVLQDHIKAFQHYLAAASLGDLDAMHNLGNAYLKGNGVPQDLQKAGEWFDRSAKAGNSESMVALALTLLVSGNPSPHQVKRALSLVQKAGDLNNRVAFYVMGKIYQEGPGGIEPDENKAYMYFMKSAQAGVPASQLQVALTLRFGTLEGLPADKIEALKWAMLADLGGEPEASKVIRALRSTLPESDIARAESRAALFTPVDMDISLRGKVRFNSPPRSSP